MGRKIAKLILIAVALGLWVNAMAALAAAVAVMAQDNHVSGNAVQSYDAASAVYADAAAPISAQSGPFRTSLASSHATIEMPASILRGHPFRTVHYHGIHR